MGSRSGFASLLALALVVGPPALEAQDRIDLAGTWRVRLDREDVGVEQQWQRAAVPDAAPIELPGDLAQRGFGDPVTADTKWTGGVRDPNWAKDPMWAPFLEKDGMFRFPFWLQPERHYVGVAWYQREIEIPEAWRDRRIVLHLERPHWETRVWIDDRSFGRWDTLSTPHEYVRGVLEPGTHRLTVRVDNRMIVDVGENSHSVSDHTQGNWNGLVGKLELRSTPQVWIEYLVVRRGFESHSISVFGGIGNESGEDGRGVVELDVRRLGSETSCARLSVPGHWATPRLGSDSMGGDRKQRGFHVEIDLGGDVALWDEFSPTLYRVTAKLDGGHTCETTFGLREVTTEGTTFRINGRPLFFRGTLECAIFPATGHPPCDVESWRHVIRRCKEHGLNHIRFHSWCPPEAAFVAADELGFYLQVECASWANQSTTLGDGKPVDEFVEGEAWRIEHTYGHHPSFVLMAYGNEPGGPNHRAWLSEWLRKRSNSLMAWGWLC